MLRNRDGSENEGVAAARRVHLAEIRVTQILIGALASDDQVSLAALEDLRADPDSRATYIFTKSLSNTFVTLCNMVTDPAVVAGILSRALADLFVAGGNGDRERVLAVSREALARYLLEDLPDTQGGQQ